MRIHIADGGETLRTIARTYKVDLSALIALNLDISDSDANVSGRQVRLPSSHPIVGNAKTMARPANSGYNYIPNWIPTIPLERMQEKGGAAVVWRLCERWRNNGKRFAVVEKGGLLLPTQVRNLPTMHHSRLTDYFHYVSEPVLGSIPHFAGARQLFALGGRTLFWDLGSSRLELSMIPQWPIPIHEMDAYYEIAEKIMKVTRKYTEGASMSDALLDRLHHGGFPDATRLPLAIELFPSMLGAIRADVCFSSISLLAKALHICPFDLTVQSSGRTSVD